MAVHVASTGESRKLQHVVSVSAVIDLWSLYESAVRGKIIFWSRPALIFFSIDIKSKNCYFVL